MMKSFKRIYNIILMAMIVLIPFVEAKAASVSVPITVDWYIDDVKWDEAPHRTDIKIEPLNGAPLPNGVDEFYGIGDLKFDFAPEFTAPGRYEYLIYQNNEDINQEDRSVIYDKTKYHLVYIVEQGKNGLNISVYAYDNDKYISNGGDIGKAAEIIFKNNDPHLRRDDGSIIKPGDPDYPGKKPDSQKPGDKPGIDDPEKPGDKPYTNDPEKPGDKPGTSEPGKSEDIIGTDNPTNTNDSSKTKKFGKDRSGNTNVRTGIESNGIFLIILIVATNLYYFIKRANKEEIV